MKPKPADARFRNLILSVGLLAPVACGSTGVVPTGENQYMVSETDIGDTWSSGDKVLAKLYREANDFCAERNMAVETVAEDSAPGRTFVRNASATLRFRCVERGSKK
jgi:hypothetical protein